MTHAAPQPIFRHDYKAPDYLVEHIGLVFRLDAEATRVTARLTVRRNGTHDRPMLLNGEKLVLDAVRVDGEALAEDQDYSVTDRFLSIARPPAAFVLETEVTINPSANTELEGLYVSGGNFCTQCEPEGFRKITYFVDRPDIMARYTVRMEADKARVPLLLSNGNRIDQGELADGRHFAVWEDPFPKPSYLFALVAGDLAGVHDSYTTGSGRKVDLSIWVQHGNESKCAHAMKSLQQAMKWDEEVYGLEYDLDLFNIVAVDDFNFGAMENKSLNIFNSKYVLADQQTATDTDYSNIAGIVAHEYFHNWSGNRVTCRDWFQLSLKEGLTVFRDQEFSADHGERAVERIGDVRRLRAAQFPEDSGPLAHPVRPDSYIEINNFYTSTVYEKGAEVVRMYRTLLGARGYRKGTDLYFQRHDGNAVTCDDFRAAMADANGADFGQFERWYDTAGTPVVKAQGQWDAEAGTYALTLTQEGDVARHMPVAVGLIGADGRDLRLRLTGESIDGADSTTRVLELKQKEETFIFTSVNTRPVPSLLRGFSAPVKLEMEESDADLAFRLAHDSDGFNRWEAGQKLATRLLLARLKAAEAGSNGPSAEPLIDALSAVLDSGIREPAFAALALTLPGEGYIAEQLATSDPEQIHAVREALRREIADTLWDKLQATYAATQGHEPFAATPAQAGRRALRNAVLAYIAAAGRREALNMLLAQYQDSDNMTERLAALTLLADETAPEAEAALEDFHTRWRMNPLVMGKWFAIQAASSREDTLARVLKLTQHPAFDARNPNKVYALIGGFAFSNPARFNKADGSGYRFLAEQALAIDKLNPSVGAHLLESLSRWRRLEPGRASLMQEELRRVVATAGISSDLYEIASKSLA
ncbi:aminopeptidase N [Radicibacter daui]|uniref:aminopeptidase N n=1 Tax=Radicibacter daui TaxID=3064829 RepID=UPI004046D6C2